KANADRIKHLLDNITKSVRTYLVKKSLISLLIGSLYALITWLFGMDFPIFWGFLAFILNFIPNVGSLVGTVFPVLFSLVQFDSFLSTIILPLFLVVAQNFGGNRVKA